MKLTKLAFAVIMLAAGCAEAPTAPTVVEAPASITTAQPLPVVVTVPPPEPFCPYEKIDISQSNLSEHWLTIQFDPYQKDGKVFGRYAGELERYDADNQWRVKGRPQIEIQSPLSGPQNKTYYDQLALPSQGRYRIRLRAAFPNECHDDGHGNQRLNGEWSEYFYFTIPDTVCEDMFYQGNGQWGCEDKGLGKRPR